MADFFQLCASPLGHGDLQNCLPTMFAAFPCSKFGRFVVLIFAYFFFFSDIKRFNIWQVNLEKESLEAGEPGEAVPVQAEAAEGGDHVQVEALPGQVQLLVTYYNIYNSAEGGDHAQVETLPGQVHSLSQIIIYTYNSAEGGDHVQSIGALLGQVQLLVTNYNKIP